MKMRNFNLFILTVALFFVSCKEGEKSEQKPRKVQCEAAVLSSDIFENATFPGKVVAATDVNLGFRVAGIIDEICISDGSYVSKGEVVARLDKRDYALQLEATQAEYDAVKAEACRVVALYADNSVSANDYDKAVNGLKAITVKLEAHKNSLKDTELRAPFSGYLHKSNFDKGEAVAAGTPVVSIISSSAPEITIDIPAAYYLKQKQFSGARASIDVLGDTTFDLALKGISPKANLNQLYRATFVVENRGGVTPSVGMSAMVVMNYQRDENEAVLVKFSAVVERDSNSSLWIVENGKVLSRPIEVLEINSDGTALVSGARAGEEVVVAGVNSLKEGQEVSILERPSATNIGGVK